MPPEASPSPVRVLAVASGKGGVGKTNVSVNLATALTALGERVVLLDADFGLANVDVLLGLTPKQTLADVIAGRATLPEVMLTGPRGLLIVPSASGKRHMAEMNPAQHAGIVQAVSAYDGPLDTLVVDTAAGINDAVLTFCQAAQEVLVVVCDEPASITDEASLAYLGAIPQDEALRRAVQKQKAVVDAFPAAQVSAAFRELAGRIHRWARPSTPRGHVEFFVERMLHAGGARA